MVKPVLYVVPENPEKTRTIYGVWLCKVCRQQMAFWPHEIGWQKSILGVRFQIILRAPYACTNCRIMRFKEQQRIGQQNYQPFWANVIALVTGDTQIRTASWIAYLNYYRSRFRWWHRG